MKDSICLEQREPNQQLPLQERKYLRYRLSNNDNKVTLKIISQREVEGTNRHTAFAIKQMTQ